jgi:hypothetical protein
VVGLTGPEVRGAVESAALAVEPMLTAGDPESREQDDGPRAPKAVSSPGSSRCCA